jgi:hypothetical protein
MANGQIFGHLLEELTDGVTVFRDGVGKPMPLTSTAIDIDITAGLATIISTRTFSNQEDVPIEAILTMPVGFNAVVTGLFATIDGRKLRAVAKLKKAARDNYEAAIDQGKMAILHEEALRGIHVLSIGHLASGKVVEVQLRMVVPLVMAEGGPFLRLPMTAGQLYGSSPLQPADNLITDAKVRHEATLTVRADAGIPNLTGRGPVTKDDSVNITLDRAIDIVVEGGQFGARTGISADGYQVRVDLRPQQIADGHLKLAIVVDRSGSTSSPVGNGAETVLSAMRNGLADALSKTHDEDQIALWQFSTECQRLGTGRGVEVLQLLKKLNQPGGGTRLGAAIRKVAASGIKDILVLTDGQTWETLPVLAAELEIRISAVLVGRASLDANIGHLCALTGGDLFYVPDAEVGPSVLLALNSSRLANATREIELMDGRPSRVKRSLGGVEIVACWSDSMEIGVGTDVGGFAAWLCLGQMDEDAAKSVALREGLCTHATSLVLVDEVATTNESLAETRKIPLMSAEDVQLSAFVNARTSVPMMARETGAGMPRFGTSLLGGKSTGLDSVDSADAFTPEQQQERLREVRIRIAEANIWNMRRLGSNLDKGPQSQIAISEENQRAEARLKNVAEGIDWEMQCNRFLALDFSGLQADEEWLLDALARREGVKTTVQKADADTRLLLLAYLAARFVTHSRAAQRFARRVLDRICGWDFVAELDSRVLVSKREDN